MAELKTFQSVITQLWQSLELGEPEFSNRPSIILSVENIEVILNEDITGQTLVIEGDGGNLTRNPAIELHEVEKLLKLNFAMTVSHQTLTVVEESDKNTRLKIQAFYDYSAHDLMLLSELISDVISAVETYHRITMGNAVSGNAEQKSRALPIEEMIVFQP